MSRTYPGNFRACSVNFREMSTGGKHHGRDGWIMTRLARLVFVSRRWRGAFATSCLIVHGAWCSRTKSQAATHQASSLAARYNRDRVVPPSECLVPEVAVGHLEVHRPYLTAFVSFASVWSTSTCGGFGRQSNAETETLIFRTGSVDHFCYTC